MKKNILNKNSAMSPKGRMLSLGITTALLVIFASTSIKTFAHPMSSEQRNKLNEITQKTNITYSTEALPDGMVGEKGAIFSKAQKNISLKVVSTIESEKPVSVTGQGKIYYDLIAEGLWQQPNAATKDIKLDSKGSKNAIIDESFQINLEDIKNKIDKIENEVIGTSPSKYILKIRPDLHGNIEYEDKKIPLDNTYELSFEYSGGIFRLTGENKEFIKSIPIDEIMTANIKFSFLGIKMPVVLSRCLFSLISIILLILSIINFKALKPNLTVNKESSNYIDRKYNSRMVSLEREPNISSKDFFQVSSFKELLRMADEKELNILRYSKSNSYAVIYSVIDDGCIFTYTASSLEDTAKIALNNLKLGSDIFNGR